MDLVEEQKERTRPERDGPFGAATSSGARQRPFFPRASSRSGPSTASTSGIRQILREAAALCPREGMALPSPSPLTGTPGDARSGANARSCSPASISGSS